VSAANKPKAQVGVQYTLAVGSDDVGARVVIRRRLADGLLGDLLGELLSWDDETVAVLDRHGVGHTVRTCDVVAAKRIPPAPERRR